MLKNKYLPTPRQFKAKFNVESRLLDYNIPKKDEQPKKKKKIVNKTVKIDKNVDKIVESREKLTAYYLARYKDLEPNVSVSSEKRRFIEDGIQVSSIERLTSQTNDLLTQEGKQRRRLSAKSNYNNLSQLTGSAHNVADDSSEMADENKELENRCRLAEV